MSGTGARSLTALSDLLTASASPEGLASRWPSVSGACWRAVSIGSGPGLLSAEVSGKMIGMERDLALGDQAEWPGSGVTAAMRTLDPFFTYFTQRERERDANNR